MPNFKFQQIPPRIAIVIDDLGLDRHSSKRAMELRIPLTLAFLPYADDLAAQTATGLEQPQQHELLVHLPMEPLSKKSNPGPGALKTSFSREEVVRNLEFNLSRFTGYAGISNHMGSKFTTDPERMLWLMQEIKLRKLYFLDSVTSQYSVARMAAEKAHVPFIERDIFLDHVNKEEVIRKQLRKALRIARKKGVSVAICHPRETTLNVLESWLETKDASRYQYVTLGNIVKY